ncbi:MAG: hypothetical protein KAH20_11360 [Methylococcales bacterium]|nr:hypothetical protein [Methylococcales bacterium]
MSKDTNKINPRGVIRDSKKTELSDNYPGLENSLLFWLGSAFRAFGFMGKPN